MTRESIQAYLPVSDGHRLFYRIEGPRDGIPVLFLHGGPGSGFPDAYTAFFADKPVRLIAFDQRGTGQSTPRGPGPANTTQHLLHDIEQLRTELGIAQWYVAGHSWGSTLALLYALAYTDHCTGLLLASLFLGRRRDQEQTFRNAMIHAPDLFRKMCDGLYTGAPDPVRFEHELYKRLHSEDPDEQYDAAYRFDQISSVLVRLQPRPVERSNITEASLNKVRILLDYAAHDFFIPDNIILDQAERLTHMPIWLLHGQSDLDCLPQQALDLKTRLPQIDLRLVEGAHSLLEEPYRTRFQDMIDDAIGSLKA